MPVGKCLLAAVFDGPVVVEEGEVGFGGVTLEDVVEGLEFGVDAQGLGNGVVLPVVVELGYIIGGGSCFDAAAGGDEVSCHESEEGGLADAVVADEGQFLVGENGEVEV